MPRKKAETKATKTDRHKPSRMVRIKGRLAEQLDMIAERNATDFTDEANRAIRELLEREGLWPLPGTSK